MQDLPIEKVQAIAGQVEPWQRIFFHVRHMPQECADLHQTQLARMPLPMKQDMATTPICHADGCVVAMSILFRATHYLIQQPRPLGGQRLRLVGARLAVHDCHSSYG